MWSNFGCNDYSPQSPALSTVKCFECRQSAVAMDMVTSGCWQITMGPTPASVWQVSSQTEAARCSVADAGASVSSVSSDVSKESRVMLTDQVIKHFQARKM